MIKRADLQYLLREGLQIECCVVSNTYAYCMYKGEVNGVEYEYIFEEYGEENWIPLEVCRKMKGFFSKKWLIITEIGYSTRKLEKEDKQLAKEIELRCIYDYLGISKYFQWSIDDELILHDIEYYHDLLLNASADELSIALHSLQKPDKTFLFNIACMLYKENVFNDMRKIDIIEQYFNRLDFFRLDL